MQASEWAALAVADLPHLLAEQPQRRGVRQLDCHREQGEKATTVVAQ